MNSIHNEAAAAAAAVLWWVPFVSYVYSWWGCGGGGSPVDAKLKPQVSMSELLFFFEILMVWMFCEAHTCLQLVKEGGGVRANRREW